MTFALAVRNLLRNRRRSLATLLAIAIGVAAVLLFGGYSSNIKYTLQTTYVRNGGHLQIQHRDFFLFGSGNPTAYGIVEYEKVLSALLNDDVMKGLLFAAAPTLQFGAIAGNYAAGVSRTVIGTGILAPEYSRMQEWNGFDVPLVSPPSALDGSPADSVVLGTGVARVLQLCAALKIANCPQRQEEQAADGAAVPEDIAQLSLQESHAAPSAPANSRRIELLASTSNGTPNVASLQVVRAQTQSFKELDEVAVITHLAQAQRLVYGRAPPRATAIVLQLHRTDQIDAAQARLAALLPTLALSQPLSVLDFATLNPYYVQTIQLFETIFRFIFILIGGIVLFNVSNTMNTAVVERTVEIGTLRAIGLRRGGIRRLFIVEGLLLGLAGSLVGVAAALAVAFVVNRAGLTWLPPGVVDSVPLELRVWNEPATMVGTSVGLVLVATLSACWPAHRAARMVVVDALRHV
ncbi:MAG: FtsX-like permease family protein [Caldimonas sp.]